MDCITEEEELAAVAGEGLRERGITQPPWYDDVVPCLLANYVDEREILSELDTLLRGPYVMIVTDLVGGAPASAALYPSVADVPYDDVYERTASGCSIGAGLRIYRSDGREFDSDEHRRLCAQLAEEFYDNAADDGDDGWTIEFYGDPEDPGCVIEGIVHED